MTVLRATAITCGLTLLAAWMAAAAGARLARAPVRSSDVARPGASAASPAAAGPVSVAGHARPSSVITGARRNIFQTRDRAPAEPPSPPAGRPAADVPPSGASPLPATSVLLLGIAEHDEQGRLTRTAVFSSGGELWLVQEGATVAGRFRVGPIGTDRVELADMLGGPPRTLRLR